MKVVIVNGNSEYRALFAGMGHTLISDIAKADLVVFTGGADVSPSIYGDKQHPYTGSHIERDAKEAAIFNECIQLDIPMAGICRGAQFLNVMSGGRMYQHVERHTQPHTITDLQTGETIFVSSTHHQMMLPSPDALLVASSYQYGSREWYDGEVRRQDVSKQDIEVVFYEKTKALCFQPHPEFNSPEYEGMQRYFKELLQRYLGVA